MNDERSEEDAIARLVELKAELAAGADFAELAQEHSEDPGSAEQGGALGDAALEAEGFVVGGTKNSVAMISTPASTNRRAMRHCWPHWFRP